MYKLWVKFYFLPCLGILIWVHFRYVAEEKSQTEGTDRISSWRKAFMRGEETGIPQAHRKSLYKAEKTKPGILKVSEGFPLWQCNIWNYIFHLKNFCLISQRGNNTPWIHLRRRFRYPVYSACLINLPFFPEQSTFCTLEHLYPKLMHSCNFKLCTLPYPWPRSQNLYNVVNEANTGVGNNHLWILVNQ